MLTRQNLLSERMSRIDTSAIRRVFDLASKLPDPINLSIGQPHYPAPAGVVEAAAKALRDGKTAYTPTQGIVPLRERLSKKYLEVNGFKVSPDDILVSSGVSSLIQLLFMTMIDPGDRIVLTDPCFLIYRGLANFFGAQIEWLPENFTDEDLSAINTDRLKMILFCSPSNPTGRVMGEEQIRKLGNFSDKTGALLVSDEIYELFDYEKKFVSTAKIFPGAMTLSGFSKTYSMTGLRLASAAGPSDIIKAMTILQQYTIVCAPSDVQWAGIAALDLDMSSYVQMYKKNRDRCMEVLKGKVSFPSPDGAFYIFPDVGQNDDQFVQRAIQEKQLLIVPGNIFSRSDRNVRISYATSPEILERGLSAFMDLL